ncbi:alpha-1,3-mannosyl-glycoprotein 2-beta-N-acetylglucosaminyltransferase isoform X2 [Lycorma delicatula]|uniref:alpha-1,3-mannosyl-glycoprotein 2-beta-N-acetylglucosaminyltransferase isoform X2 n=1 Tax=Lycorma delicatula TaxID=130591 RepID=UPI003F50F1B9
MRKHHLTGLIVVSFLSWAIVIYFILEGPHGNRISLLKSPDIDEKLVVLEEKIKEELKANEVVRSKLHQAIELRIKEKEKAIEDEKRKIQIEEVYKVESAEKEKQPDQSEIQIPPKEKKFKGYFKIARHYGWALNQTFFNFNFNNVIIIEDDLDVSPDLFEYFLGTLPILLADPTLWCVSAWNDNGKLGLIQQDAPHLLHRTDFFPGLGWMLTKNTWLELAPKWPRSYWDDWIRQPEQRRGRACIRPEISRTRTFGKIGVSNGLFYEKYLKYIHLNDKFVPFTQLNLTYLLQDNYDVQFVKSVYESMVVTYQELKANSIVTDGPVRIPYYTKDKYKRTAKMLGLMDDFRSGVPRTGYRGVVSFFYNNRRVYLAPNANWKGYDITWS